MQIMQSNWVGHLYNTVLQWYHVTILMLIENGMSEDILLDAQLPVQVVMNV